VTADNNVSSIFSIGGAAPHRFFEAGVCKPLIFEVTIKCFVQGARAEGDTIEGSEHLVYNTRGVGVWRAWRGRDEESAIDALWRAICLNECLCKVDAAFGRRRCTRAKLVVQLRERYRRLIVAFNFSPRNLTQVTSAIKTGQGAMIDFTSVKRVTFREGLY